MNKKLFVLLPATLLMLAACNGGNDVTTTDSSTTTSEKTTTTGKTADPLLYGTKENPLTVAAWKENVANLVGENDGEFSDFIFYVKGYVSKTAVWNTNYNQFGNFYVVDTKGVTSGGMKVQRAQPGTGVEAGSTLYAGDEVLVSGFAEYYSGYYSLFPGDEDPLVLSHVYADSTLTVTKSSKVTLSSELNKTYKNGSQVTFAPVAVDGYKVQAFLNGVEMTANSNGAYSFTMDGDMTLDIKAVTTADPLALPKGEYKFDITMANSGLTSTASSKETSVSLPVIQDTEDAVYVRPVVTFSSGCLTYPDYSEFKIGNKSTVTVTTPTGVVSSVVVEYYKDDYSVVYKGSADDANKVTGTKVDPETTGYSNTYAKKFETNDATAIVKSSGGTLVCYKIIVNITVA